MMPSRTASRLAAIGAPPAQTFARAVTPASPIWLPPSHRSFKFAMAPLACLTLLNLRNNKIGDAGVESLAKACAGGAMAQLTYLSIGSNQIGNAGVTALADACARGALAQLTTLHLEYNKIGDAGVEALAKACASGAMASLTTIFVDSPNHPALKAACQARGIKIARF